MKTHRLWLALTVLNLLATRGSAGQVPAATGRYVVTATPITITGLFKALCVGVDPTDAHGVWWWEPGRSGCSSRSTGPGVFPAEDATVSRSWVRRKSKSASKSRSMVGGPVDVILTVRDGSVFDSKAGVPGPGTNVGVRSERRDDLVLPESAPRLPPR